MEKLDETSQGTATTELSSLASSSGFADWTKLSCKYEPHDSKILEKYEELEIVFDEPLSSTSVSVVRNKESEEVSEDCCLLIVMCFLRSWSRNRSTRESCAPSSHGSRFSSNA